MKRTVFTKSIQFLIISLLLLAVFLPRKIAQMGMVIVATLWVIYSIIYFIYRHLRKRDKSTSIDKSIQNSPKEKHFQLFKLTSQIPNEKPLHNEKPKPLSKESPTTVSDNDCHTMLVHIALRISDKLKSAYPDAIWQWAETPSLHDILEGKTIRICVENMSSYNHADVFFDSFGRIHVTPMKIGTFSPEEENTTSEEKSSEPAPVDVRVWYDLVGQQILENHITELNTKGHGKLIIKENGDIVINRQKKEVLIATLDSFPPKQYWNELVTILEENELCAKANDKNLIVSWLG